MAIKICIAQNKGGNHKTTVAVNLADALKRMKYKVLLIDMDEQENASTTYGASIHQTCTMVDLLKKECSAREAIQHKELGDIIAGDRLLSDIEYELNEKGNTAEVLADALKTIEKNYDYIIIDTPPNVGTYTKTALSVADGVIIPILASKFAIDGLGNLISKINMVQKNQNKKLKIYGIVQSGYSSRRKMDNDVKNMLPQKVNIHVFDTTISQCHEVTKVQALSDECKSLFKHYPKCKAASDFEEFANEVVKITRR